MMNTYCFRRVPMKQTVLLAPFLIPLLTGGLWAAPGSVSGLASDSTLLSQLLKMAPDTIPAPVRAPGVAAPTAPHNPLKIFINLNAAKVSDPQKPADAKNIFNAAGIRVTDATSGTDVAILNADIECGGQAVKGPKEGPNVLTQKNINGPITFTLRFPRPVCEFSFNRAALIAGVNGVIHPTWSAFAIAADDRTEIDHTTEQTTRYFNRSRPDPAETFTLKAEKMTNGFMSVRISSNGDSFGGPKGSYHEAGFSGVLMTSINVTYCALP